ncbi:vascular endothelial growth factor receptor 1 [Anopheles nili]|uniref:vascular endothelial growth factor receptor 1 n=1 Tax=Anopheles nili TaxID=185578 RepID=UPI00237BDE57|nr:vascular endothelial growth factor receptor 1 [Anopheles nili]
MELFRKAIIYFLIVFTVLDKRKARAEDDIHGLIVTPVRSDRTVKLHVRWNTSLPNDTQFLVTIEHIDSDSCPLKESPFENLKHIKCAPIVDGSVSSLNITDVVLPSDTTGISKHACSIQQLCTYSVQVETINFTFRVRQIVAIPDCVDQLCSCHYAQYLPPLVDTSAVINQTSNELIVSWKLGPYNLTDLPEHVNPVSIYIGVRRGTNNELAWGGQHSSIKELIRPFEAGSFSFDINQFAGNKFIFVVQLKVIDTRECERAAKPLRVILPEPDRKQFNTTRENKANCIDGTHCNCDRLNNFPDLLLNAKCERDQIVVTWYSLKSYIEQQRFSSGNIALQLAITLESSGALLCSATTDPRTSNTYTFFLNDLPLNQSSGLLLVSTFIDSSNHCQRHMPSYKLQYHASKPILLPVLIVLFLIFIIIAVGGSLFVYVKRRSTMRWKANNWREVYVRSSDHHPQIAMEENRLYIDMDILNARARGDADYLEIPHSCLRIGREIGKGAFGRVFMASAVKLPGFSGPKIVAIKQLKKCSSSDEFDEFLDEITMMKKVGKHPNIVVLLGCCTIKEPLTMIMEYVGCGDLLEYLRKIRAKHLAKVHQLDTAGTQSENTAAGTNIFSPMVKYLDLLHTSSSTSDASYITQTDTATRPSVTETTYTILSGTIGDEDSNSALGNCSLEYVLDHNELHNFAKQIACGMEHLEELQITHRDLAARNILIDERKTLKISDFGLSRTGIYVNTRNKKVPLRWLSVEAMRDNLYSNKSDVWAFGIVLWEIGTLGGYPYPSVSNHELFAFLQEGKRLERPENCTTEVYELMLQCWREDPNERPSFKQISKHMQPHKKIYIDFNEIEPTYVFPPTSDQIRLAIANNK